MVFHRNNILVLYITVLCNICVISVIPTLWYLWYLQTEA